ncbi:MAG: hypothetical protein ACKPCM_19145, partial [Pseudanabaena sp.]
MSETPQNLSIPDNDLPDDIPLGNSHPLLVPAPLGQLFLQPKFIYPLGAVSIINPDSLSVESDFEPLSDSFKDSPFFDSPLPISETSIGISETASRSNKSSRETSIQRFADAKLTTSNSEITNKNLLENVQEDSCLISSMETLQNISTFSIQKDVNLTNTPNINTNSDIILARANQDIPSKNIAD